jgi:uncharacterized glyoxalase superfamily protein PhnB
MAIKGARAENRTVTPHLVVRGAAEAIEFYKRAFGAVELYRSPLPGMAGLHAHVRIGKTMVTDEYTGTRDPENIDMQVRLLSPQSLGGASGLLEILVDDVDAAYTRAVDAGATPVLPLSDCFWGDRYGWVADPFGHLWALATVKEELTPEEVHRRMTEMMAQTQKPQ